MILSEELYRKLAEKHQSFNFTFDEDIKFKQNQKFLLKFKSNLNPKSHQNSPRIDIKFKHTFDANDKPNVGTLNIRSINKNIKKPSSNVSYID